MSYTDLTKKDIIQLNYTNLYLAEILISDYIENHNDYKGLTKSEIASRWNNDERYRKQFVMESKIHITTKSDLEILKT